MSTPKPKRRDPPRKTASAAPIIPILYTRNDVGYVLGCSRPQTYALQATDEDFPPPLRIGASWFWLATEINRYVKIKAAARPRYTVAHARPAATGEPEPESQTADTS
jgi:predicted DNA-binding transcriptional regulator AlpA